MGEIIHPPSTHPAAVQRAREAAAKAVKTTKTVGAKIKDKVTRAKKPKAGE